MSKKACPELVEEVDFKKAVFLSDSWMGGERKDRETEENHQMNEF